MHRRGPQDQRTHAPDTTPEADKEHEREAALAKVAEGKRLE